MSSDEKPGDAAAASEDLDELARQYLDLWRDQLTALSANPAISEAMAGFFAKWSPAVAPAAADGKDGEADASGADSSGLGANGLDASGLDDGGQTDGAAAAGSSSVAGGDRIGELLDRLDRIEERLARLEQQRR